MTTDNDENKNSPSTDSAVERRELFRVQGQALVTAITTQQPSQKTTNQNQALEKLFPSSAIDAVIRELKQIDQSNSQILNVIANRNSNTANYLRGINRKIEVIAQYLVTPSPEDTDAQLSSIDISENGLSFLTREEFNKLVTDNPNAIIKAKVGARAAL